MCNAIDPKKALTTWRYNTGEAITSPVDIYLLDRALKDVREKAEHLFNFALKIGCKESHVRMRLSMVADEVVNPLVPCEPPRETTRSESAPG